jgi:hypothetical protein
LFIIFLFLSLAAQITGWQGMRGQTALRLQLEDASSTATSMMDQNQN